jgi:hypothetical protein
MPQWALKSNVAALNTARYQIPEGRTCGVADGVEMRVRTYFRIDGVLVLDGMLTVAGE